MHQHPELSFQEENTSKFVASILSDLNICFRDGVAGTGIIAEIQGSDPSSKLVALRADMDALPIQEENEVSYRSQNDGLMHACGHDVHTSSLLGVARILKSVQNDFSGTIRLIFQPGEEQLPGGASLMIKEGALKSPVPSSIFGQHVFPELPSGKIGFMNRNGETVIPA
ncbi:MAG: M20 metallopeptidase family protein, partial [Flavobacteriales bacterium]